MGLLEALKQFASDAVGGSLNPEVGNTLSGLLNYGKDRARYIGGLLDDSSPINKDFKNWHDRTQLGLADLIAGREGPQADYGYNQIMNMAGVAPLGITAWHGSPHKFDKFSLDKIGTGEGAQAYGHGLYLAESPEVANQYRINLAYDPEKMKVGGKQINAVYDSLNRKAATMPVKDAAPIYDQMDMLERLMANDTFENVAEYAKGLHPDAQKWLHTQVKPTFETYGHTYKTDIPDEAVARFLDWDKPLSQQAPEVQAALSKIGYDTTGKHGSYSVEQIYNGLAATSARKAKAAGTWEYSGKTGAHPAGVIPMDYSAATQNLHQQGIPGIRYLDGGSRSSGQGTSNFVAFDPEMIRILERNGQPTGLEPWKPGEYRLGDLLK